jgi:bZIP factor
VQRDPTGSGIVDTDVVKQGWVPAGCLLETKVPVASAIAEATAAKGNAPSSDSPPETPVSKTPILPLSIISTSFPGIALMDYKKKGDEELDLVKDDALRVFKRYNHWSYVRCFLFIGLRYSWLSVRLSRRKAATAVGYRCVP